MGKVVNIKGKFWTELLSFLWKDIAKKDMLAFSEIKLILPTNRAINSFKAELKNHFKFSCSPRIVSISNIVNLYEEIPLVENPESYRVCALANSVREFENAGVSACFHKAYFLDKLINDFKLMGVDVKTLDNLVDASFALNWAKTSNFLKYIFNSTENFVSSIDNKLSVLKQKLEDKNPLVIAGVWNVVGAYREFVIKKIVSNDNSYFVLGNCIDDINVEDNHFIHPQKVIKELLDEMQVFKPIEFIEYDKVEHINLKLVSRCFQKVNSKKLSKLSNVELVEARCQLEEAACIAAIVKKNFNKGKINIVTNDKTLVLMVKSILNNLGVDIDDSIGVKLDKTPAGVLILKLSLFLCELDIYLFLDILTHPLIKVAGFCVESVLKLSKRLKEDMNFYLLVDNAVNSNVLKGKILAKLSLEENYLLKLVIKARNIVYNKDDTLQGFFKILIEISELLVEVREENMASCLNVLKEHLSYINSFKSLSRLDNKEEVRALISHILSREVVRPIRPEANVHIVEVLEFSLMESEVVILASLNEGNWPGSILPNPWLNKRMLKELGISSEELIHNNYLNAFIEAFKASKVFLTRSLKIGGASTIASRFLTNIWNLLPNRNDSYVQYGRELLEETNDYKAVEVANTSWPSPEIENRPKIISATGLFKLANNPYAYYIEKILKLRPLSYFNFTLQHFDSREFARIKGILFHKIMEQALKDKSVDSLNIIFSKVVTKLLNTDNKEFPIDEKLALMLYCSIKELIPDWIQLIESGEVIKDRLLEEFGKLTLDNGITLTAVCDRIDVLKEGSIDVIDYKTSILPSKSSLKENMQLLAQAYIATLGGFSSLKSNIFYDSYLSLVNLNSCKSIKISFEEIRGSDFSKIEQVTSKYLNSKEHFVLQGPLLPNDWIFPYVRQK